MVAVWSVFLILSLFTQIESEDRDDFQAYLQQTAQPATTPCYWLAQYSQKQLIFNVTAIDITFFVVLVSVALIRNYIW